MRTLKPSRSARVRLQGLEVVAGEVFAQIGAVRDCPGLDRCSKFAPDPAKHKISNSDHNDGGRDPAKGKFGKAHVIRDLDGQL